MKRLFTHTVLAGIMLVLFSACSSDVIMYPEKVIQKGDALAAKGRHAEAMARYDSVIEVYCEHNAAYARRARSKAATGDMAGAAADIVRALRGGVDAKGLDILSEIAPDCLELLVNEVRNECTVYQTADLMCVLGTAYEAAGRAKDALNAFSVAASMEERYAADCERLASVKDQAGLTDGEYFTRQETDGTVTTNLRFLDPYWGGPVPAGAPTTAEKAREAERIALGLKAPEFRIGDYPVLARKRHIEGTVTARVNVDAHGKLKAVRIMDGVHFTLDSETVKAISSFGGWSDYNAGKAVSFVVPVTWAL